MKTNLYSRIGTFLILTSVFLFSSCDLDIPVNELISARQKIDEAREFKAGKYSSDKLKKSEELLYESHKLLKDDKADDAKKKAIESLKHGEQALAIALEAYSSDLIKDTEKRLNECRDLYSEKLAPVDYTEADRLHKDAQKQYSDKKYRESIETSLKAIASAERAKKTAMQKAGKYHDKYSFFLKRYKKLRISPYRTAVTQELDTISKDLNGMKTSLDSKKYRDSYNSSTTIEKELSHAEMKILKAQYILKIGKLRKEIAGLVSDNEKDTIKISLDKASVALNKAESFLEQNKLASTNEHIKTAEALIANSKRYKMEMVLKQEIEKVQKKITTARQEDSQEKEKENIAKAEKELDSAQNSLKDSDYDKTREYITRSASTIDLALKNIAENEKNLAALKVKAAEEEKRKAEEEKKASETEKAEDQFYTVKWRKKNTDCLWRISQKLYKDASLWPAIFLANREQIKDPDLIFPGQKLKIPPKPEKRPPLKIERDNKAVRKDK